VLHQVKQYEIYTAQNVNTVKNGRFPFFTPILAMSIFFFKLYV